MPEDIKVEQIPAPGFEGLGDVGGGKPIAPPMIDKVEPKVEPEVKEEGKLDSNKPVITEKVEPEAKVEPKPLTVEDLAKFVQETGMSVKQLTEALKPKPEVRAPIAKEPFKPTFNATADLIEKFVSSPEGAVEVLNMLRDSILKDTAKLALDHWEQHFAAQQQEVMANQQIETMTNEFKARHTDLDKFMPEARSVAERIITDPNTKPFATREEFYDAVAKGTKELVEGWKSRLDVKPVTPVERPKPQGGRPTPSPKKGMPSGGNGGPDGDELSVIQSVITARDGM